MSETVLEVLERPDDLFWSEEISTRHLHNKIRKEAATEIRKLRRVWEAASDYQMAKRNPGFAKENGGTSKLERRLMVALDSYEGDTSKKSLSSGDTKIRKFYIMSDDQIGQMVDAQARGINNDAA